MSLGTPLDPCIQDYEKYIKEEFSVVEDLFAHSFDVNVNVDVDVDEEEKKLWLKEEEDQISSTCSTSSSSSRMSPEVVVPDLDDLMDTSDSSPDVVVPDLFQDLADLNSSEILEELTAATSQSTDMSDFLGLCPTLDKEDGLRSDIMWSSACLNEEMFMSSSTVPGAVANSSSSSKRPRRDSTLSLMECAQNLFRDFELTGFPLMDTPLPSSEDDDEEEIDVVSFEQQWNQINPHHSHHHAHHPFIHQHKHHHVKNNCNNSINTNTSRLPLRSNAGRSLLKSQQPPQPTLDHGFGDHSYHSVVQPNSAPMGILTPTESEDDEESTLYKRQNPPTIVKAVQSLIKAKPSSNSSSSSNNSNSSSKDNVKFKFRMKFKSNSNGNNSCSSGNTSSSSLSENSLLRSSCKRKSASNNTYCPPPPSTPNKSSASRSLNESCSKSSSSKRTSSSGHRHSISEAKCREVRDLHNSMERQRRVDLRNNFDQLKVVVPELKDAEKASKLNILNKSAEYCKYLTSTDMRLRKEKEQLMNRNAALTQRLSQLKSVVDRRYHQQRISEKKNNYSNSPHVPQPIRTLA